MEKIYWKKTLDLIRNGKASIDKAIDFNNEMIHWKIVQEFNNSGIKVPQELIDYDDKNIDFSDISEVNNLSLNDGTYSISLPVSLDEDIVIWLKHSKINYNKIINNYLRTFYDTLKETTR